MDANKSWPHWSSAKFRVEVSKPDLFPRGKRQSANFLANSARRNQWFAGIPSFTSELRIPVAEPTFAIVAR
jgi:hypothetical protein